MDLNSSITRLVKPIHRQKGRILRDHKTRCWGLRSMKMTALSSSVVTAGNKWSSTSRRLITNMRSDWHYMDISFGIDGHNACGNSKDSLHHDDQCWASSWYWCVEAIMKVILLAGLEESLHFIGNVTLIMSAFGTFSKSASPWCACVCVCLSGSLCVKDSCWKRQSAHEDVQREPLPAPGTSSKTRRWGQKEKKKRHESKTGGWRRVAVCVGRHMACVEGQMFVVQRGKVSMHAHTYCTHTSCCICHCSAPMGQTHRCVERQQQHAGTLTTYTTFLQQYSHFFIAYLRCHLPLRRLVSMVHSEF